MAVHFAMDEENNLLNESIDVEVSHLQIGFPTQGANMLDDFACPTAIVDHADDGATPLVQIWLVAVQKAHARFPVGYYCSEGLIDFVSNGGGQLSQRRHASDV